MISFISLTQIILIDLSLAGDNAVVIGAAVASLPVPRRDYAMTAGIAGATFLRIVMAFFAVKLLQITGLLIAGGLLLLWVAWKMVRDLGLFSHHLKKIDRYNPELKFSSAVLRIVIADVSMSLDNVLAVAGVARDHQLELVIGLVVSIALMGLAATQMAAITARHPKVTYIGIALILYTALQMIGNGLYSILE